MTIELHTAGVLGLDDLLTDLTDAGVHVTSFAALYEIYRAGTPDVLTKLLQKQAALSPIAINLNPEWSKEDLKTNLHTASEEFANAHNFLADCLTVLTKPEYAQCQFIWAGFEAGLALVPLRQDHREQLCRQAKLQELIARTADTYITYFSGPIPLRIK